GPILRHLHIKDALAFRILRLLSIFGHRHSSVESGLGGGVLVDGQCRAVEMPSYPSLLSRGMAVVPGDVGAGDWQLASGRPGDGGPICLRSIDWIIHCRGVGCC